jgi:electron transfer flavoprotein alpha subunit
MSKLLAITFSPAEAEGIAGFAHALGLPFDLLVLVGDAPADLGAEKIFVANGEDLPMADGFARGLREFAGGYSHIAAVSSMASKDGLARLAGLLDAAMVTDVLSVNNPKSFTRPMVAGSIVATVEVSADPVVLTVRPAGFAKPSRVGTSEVVSQAFNFESKAKRVSKSAKSGGRPDLTQATIVVSGGRPLKDAETFEKVIGGFADALGGAVGATRAAVDSGIAPNELQVGQTGKIVAPDLYIAAGISGSTQHMAGIKDSKVIVAINTDGDAPIFEFADLGLVADLYQALPELQSKLGK